VRFCEGGGCVLVLASTLLLGPELRWEVDEGDGGWLRECDTSVYVDGAGFAELESGIGSGLKSMGVWEVCEGVEGEGLEKGPAVDEFDNVG